jgi:flagellar biosynthesis GTPase FlhF
MIVYWITPKLFHKLTAEKSVNVYRNRTEIQENSIKDMKTHGDLDVNYGRKTIATTDRTHQRKIDKIDKKIQNQNAKLDKAKQNIKKQARKVAESMLRGHQALLQTRQKKLQQCHQKEQQANEELKVIEQQKEQLGTPGQREDRDLRKQHIMTCRTAWLENQLKKFTALLCQNLDQMIDIETVLALFLQRSAIEVETKDMLLYRFNTQGLSRKFQIVLKKLIDGFNRISLSHEGKKVVAELVGFT